MRMRGDVAYINIGGMLIRFDFDRGIDPNRRTFHAPAHEAPAGGGGVTMWAVWEGLLWHCPTRKAATGASRVPFYQAAPERQRCTHAGAVGVVRGESNYRYVSVDCRCGAWIQASDQREVAR